MINARSSYLTLLVVAAATPLLAMLLFTLAAMWK
jgi:hypothetical protein